MRAVRLFFGIVLGGVAGFLLSGWGMALCRSWNPPGPMPYGDWESPVIVLAGAILGIAIGGSFAAFYNANERRALSVVRFLVTLLTLLAMLGTIGWCVLGAGIYGSPLAHMSTGMRIAVLLVIATGPLIWFPLTVLAYRWPRLSVRLLIIAGVLNSHVAVGLYSRHYNPALWFPSFAIALLILAGAIGGMKTSLRSLFLVTAIFAANLGMVRWRFEPELRLERASRNVTELSGMVGFRKSESSWLRAGSGEYHLRFRRDRRQFDDQRVARMLDALEGGKLTVAYFHRGEITDAICDRLADASSLRVVTLHSTRVTAGGVSKVISTCDSLEYVSLSECQMDDDVVDRIVEHSSLREIHIQSGHGNSSRRNVYEFVKELRERAPDCKIKTEGPHWDGPQSHF